MGDLIITVLSRILPNIWLTILPSNGQYHDIYSCISQSWESLLPIFLHLKLVKPSQSLAGKYDVCQHQFEMLFLNCKDLLVINSVRKLGEPRVLFICNGIPSYKSPITQQKAIDYNILCIDSLHYHTKNDSIIRKEIIEHN